MGVGSQFPSPLQTELSLRPEVVWERVRQERASALIENPGGHLLGVWQW